MGPHTAALGMRFYNGNMFPSAYRNTIFVARHGSWNKTNKLGGDILAVKLNPNGSVKSWEPFVTGFLQDNAYIGRPVDVEVMKDGSLLVSDDYAGAIYRISYDGAVASPAADRLRQPRAVPSPGAASRSSNRLRAGGEISDTERKDAHAPALTAWGDATIRD